MWDLFLRMRGQWRVGFGGPVGLDMGVGLQLAAALGLPAPLVADVLPDLEATALNALRKNTGDGPDGA